MNKISNKSEKRTKHFSIRIPQSLMEKLIDYANADRRSKNTVVILALEKFLSTEKY